MATQLIYKDIGIGDEASFGASATTGTRLHVTSVTLNQDPTKEVVEDTTNTPKGRDRIQRIRNVIEGDIAGMGTPNFIHEMLELANGVLATGASVGTSAQIYTYDQNTDGVMVSKTVTLDRNNSQEGFAGVVGNQIEFTASDSRLEVTLAANAQSRGPGSALSDSGAPGETTRPFTFADFTISIGNTLNFFDAGMTTLKVSEWALTYNNNLEASHLSGNRNIDRVDPKIPELTGNFTIFHERDGFTDGTFGASEYAMRIEASTTSDNGLIAGVTPYLLRLDIPRVQLTTSVRNYEQNELSVEEINFTGLFETGSSALWSPTLTADTGI